MQVPNEDYDTETKLNSKQEVTFTIIMKMINLGRSGAFFIDRPRGIGKTFIYRVLLAQVRSRRLIALATTTSGVVVVTLLEGRTTHSRFILPLNPNDIDFCGFSKQNRTVELLRKTSLIIWDETPMENRFSIEMVDRTLRDIMDSTSFFSIFNCRMESMEVMLRGNLAEIEGQLLEVMKKKSSIVALSNV